MDLITDLEALDRFRMQAGEIVLIPTMGALHAGHGSLIRQGVELAARRGGSCMVWLFVNPTQFNDPADYARYPKTMDADVELCRTLGARAVFAPGKDDIYPPGRVIATPPLPDVATKPGLEDAKRPGHFAGVCQVVMRFFELVQPRCAVFGEKDWQQLQVVRAMTARDRPEIEIVAAPTVREADGLAMSSRNRFLSPEDRVRARALFAALREGAEADTAGAAENVMRRVLEAARVTVEYAVVRDAETLMVPNGYARRSLIAARVGTVRLIDNDAWTPRT